MTHKNGKKVQNFHVFKYWISAPTPSNATRNDVAPLKIITYHSIKTTGTLIFIMRHPLRVHFCQLTKDEGMTGVV